MADEKETVEERLDRLEPAVAAVAEDQEVLGVAVANLYHKVDKMENEQASKKLLLPGKEKND